MTNVEAIQIMIDFYEGKISYNDLFRYRADCPLCDQFYDVYNKTNRCSKCVWWKYNNSGCYEYLKKFLSKKDDNYNFTDLKKRITQYILTKKEKEFIQVRIIMLKEWLEKEKELL